MISISLALFTKRPLQDGSYPVKVYIGRPVREYINTNVNALPSEWSEQLKLCTGRDAQRKNQILTTLLSQYTVRSLQLQDTMDINAMTKEDIKHYILNGRLPENKKEEMKPSLEDLWTQVIALKSTRNAQMLKDTLRKVNLYKKASTVMFEDINKLWLDGFVASLGPLAPNTISIHLRNLRTVINYAIDCEVTTNYPFRRYRIPHAETRKRALDAEVIKRIRDAEVPKWVAPYRDLFMLTFYLIGINSVDLLHLKRVTNGRVEYTRAKTHKPYSIKVEPEALEIIEKLKGKDWLLYPLDNYKNYRGFYMSWCNGLKALKEQLELPELSTYWARHSWATIASALDIPKETIAHALGHGNNTVTDIYIDFSKAKVDEANRKVLDAINNKH